MPEQKRVTELLTRWSRGDHGALNELLPVVYDDLRGLARVQLAKERAGHTLQPTALVHEVFLRLGRYERISWQNRAHFLAVTSRSMRRVLVEHARKRGAAKRRGSTPTVTLSESHAATEPLQVDLVALDEALAKLEAKDARQCRVVEMRYFGGLEHKEIADVLEVSERTVKRDWRVARLWLRRALVAI